MDNDEKQYEGETPGKAPDETPDPQPVDSHSTERGGDTDSSAIGDGPSGGAPSGSTGGDADSSATGSGPNGGAI